MKDFDIPLKINWHEGMLLSQHHFQQNDLHFAQLLSAKIRLISGYSYGVRHFTYDQEALANGIFRINYLEAIFPDGLYIFFNPEARKALRPLEVDVSIIDQFLSQDLNIYLAVSDRGSTANIGVRPRYYVLTDEYVKDENLDDNQAYIPRLFPNAFLHIGTALPEFSSGFPLCKINKVDGIYTLKNWTSPCFFVEGALYDKTLELVQIIKEKVTYLCDKLKNSVNENADTERLLLHLKPIIPSFEAFVYSKQIHPYDLYLFLANVLGVVSVLIPTELLPTIQAYNHNDIDNSIYPIIAQIEKYLSVIERGYTILHFNKKDKFFYRYITSANIKNLSKLYIGIRGTKTEIDVWLKDAIIVSDFAIDIVRSKRVQGAPRRILPNELVAKILPNMGVILYEVDIDSRFIKPEQNLHIFNPGSPAVPLEITLYLPRNHEPNSE